MILLKKVVHAHLYNYFCPTLWVLSPTRPVAVESWPISGCGVEGQCAGQSPCTNQGSHTVAGRSRASWWTPQCRKLPSEPRIRRRQKAESFQRQELTIIDFTHKLTFSPILCIGFPSVEIVQDYPAWDGLRLYETPVPPRHPVGQDRFTGNSVDFYKILNQYCWMQTWIHKKYKMKKEWKKIHDWY